MTATETKNHPGIQRCAVCKIDRKGRFILADPMAQDLFGLGEVELFGRPLTDFVDPAYHDTVEVVTAHRNPYETVFDAVPVALLDQQKNRFAATLIISVNFGGGNPTNYQVIILTDQPPTEVTSSPPGQVWMEYLEYLSECDQVESAEALARHLVALEAVASVSIYQTEVRDENLLARITSEVESHASEPDGIIETASENEVRATFGLANGKNGLAILSLDEAGLEPSSARGQAELAAVVLHGLCPVASDRAAGSDTSPAESVGGLLDQLQIGAVEIDRTGQVCYRNAVFNQLFENPTDLKALADLIELLETRGDKTAAASVAAYFRASSACDIPPGLHLNLGVEQVGTVTLSFERLHPGSENLSGTFLFSRVDASLAAGPEAIAAPIDLTLAGMDRLRSSMSAARSIWLKLEHEHHHELSGNGGFYLRSLSHHLDTVEQTLIDLEQLLTTAGAAEVPQVVDLGLVVEKLVVDFETAHTGLTLTLRQADLPRITGSLQKLTAALRHTIGAAITRANTAEVEIRISASVADATCTVLIQDNGPRLTRKQARRAFEYVGPATTNQDQARANRPAGLAQARALIRSMGGRMDLYPGGDGTAVKMVFPEA